MSREESVLFRTVYFVVWLSSFHFILVFLVCSLRSIRSCQNKAVSIQERKENNFWLLLCVFLLESASAPSVYSNLIPFICLPSDGSVCLYSYNWMEQFPLCEVAPSSPPTTVCKRSPFSVIRWWGFVVAAIQSLQVALMCSLVAKRSCEQQHAPAVSTLCFFLTVSPLLLVTVGGTMGPVLFFFFSCAFSLSLLFPLRPYQHRVSTYFLVILSCAQGFGALSSVEGIGPFVRMVTLALKLSFFVFLSITDSHVKKKTSSLAGNSYEEVEAGLCLSRLEEEEIAFQQTHLFIQSHSS